MSDVDSLIGIINDMVRGGATTESVYKKMLPFTDEAVLKEAIRKFEEELGKIRTLKKPSSLHGDIPNWYIGPDEENDIFWPALKRYLADEKGWNQTTIDSIDTASTKVISLMQPSVRPKISTRGLVIGHVQSGKTANYTAVIAKAADVNYKFFIVLTGMTNALRSQTQSRLQRELANLNDDKWFVLTSMTDDFRPTGSNRNVNAFLTEHSDSKVLCVVKKNAAVLRRLLRWLEGASQEVLSSCPVLLIDDEADQASINASRYKDERTTINKLLLRILSNLPKAAYIGYTATPFANVLIDPSDYGDLYPRDFIVNLPQPQQYFGAERIFGRELLAPDETDEEYDSLDVIRIIPDDETSYLKATRKNKDHFQPSMTQSLERSLRYFWMAVSARKARGHEHEHSTMLIHTTVHTDVHERFRPLISGYKRGLLRLLNRNDQTLINELRAQWENEHSPAFSTEMGEQFTSFDELAPHLIHLISATDIIVENYKSDQRLSYDDEGQVQIVIGGNTLSRGLTLEGLMVSFFVRQSSAYDTVMQMGRWFGYRTGYADLPRIWMTRELESYFYDLAAVEAEIRYDIERYKMGEVTPLQFGVRIRSHPKLNVTSRLKMDAAIKARMSYSDDRFQTVLFNHKDHDWLSNNLEATKRLIENITPHHQGKVGGSNVIFRDVPSGHILAFLNDYLFHEDGTVLRSDLLTGYIMEQNAHNELTWWNVVIRGKQKKQGDEELALTEKLKVPLLNRSKRVSAQDDHAHLGVLMSYGDRVIDLDLSPDNTPVKKDSELQAYRRNQPPLLVIYPISKDSEPQARNKSGANTSREKLEAVEHLIGLGFVFPETSHQTTRHTYITVDLSGVELEEEPVWLLTDDEEVEEVE